MPEEEREHLLEVANPRWRRKSALICLGLVTLGVSALVSAILLCYFRYWDNSPSIKVLSLNTWGMPATFGSYDKELRMAAIGDFINKTEHDVYLLEELWMRPDHNNIRGRIPAGWFMTTAGEMSNGFCDGEIAPDGCSGLAIVSKFPFIEVCRKTIYLELTRIRPKIFFQRSFHGYSVKGRVSDGEVLASKVNHQSWLLYIMIPIIYLAGRGKGEDRTLSWTHC